MEAFLSSSSSSSLNDLPEECVSTILSLTSPEDACRLSWVSSSFQSAADSDLVWQNFLPSDYLAIVSRAAIPLSFSSKKELFNQLCNSILIDGGSKSFKLDRFSGTKSYVLSARDLSITWSDESMYWHWTSMPESRFSEVAVLRTMSWLEIKGKMSSKMLSPNTKYGAYLLLKISDRAFGLDLTPCEISVEVGNHQASSTANLRKKDDQESLRKQQMERLFFGNRTQMLKSMVIGGDGRMATERKDGWLEIELGEFINGGSEDDEEEVKMSLMEVTGQHLKGGLIIQGIEIRPKH